jgi:hypothetical protein
MTCILGRHDDPGQIVVVLCRCVQVICEKKTFINFKYYVRGGGGGGGFKENSSIFADQ